MAITVLILVILAKLLGFIGLVVLIYGFKSNTLANIKKGTVLFCLALIFAAFAIFMVGKKCVRHYKKKVKSIEMIMSQACCNQIEIDDCCKNKEVSVTEEGDTICIKTEVIKVK